MPRFGFAIDIDLGIDIEVFGCSFASVTFKGSLEGTTPWRIQGTATVDVWFLPTFHLDLGPYEWGDPPPTLAGDGDPLALVQQALSEDAAWKAVLPLDGDLLASLASVEVEGLVAHPLSALEVTQSRVPLETHIDRIGSAGTTANRVHLELPTTSAGPVGAVSTVVAPFAPGQFLALQGEELLARSGFADLPSGCRVAAATQPVSGTPAAADVVWHTYVRQEVPPVAQTFRPKMYAEMIVDHSLVNRGIAERENPYLPRVEKVNPTRPAPSRSSRSAAPSCGPPTTAAGCSPTSGSSTAPRRRGWRPPSPPPGSPTSPASRSGPCDGRLRRRRGDPRGPAGRPEPARRRRALGRAGRRRRVRRRHAVAGVLRVRALRADRSRRGDADPRRRRAAGLDGGDTSRSGTTRPAPGRRSGRSRSTGPATCSASTPARWCAATPRPAA